MKKTTLIATICAITILAAPATTYARDNTGAIVGSIFGAIVGAAAADSGSEALITTPISAAVGGLIGAAIDSSNDRHDHVVVHHKHYNHGHRVHAKPHHKPPRKHQPPRHHRKPPHRGRR